VPGLPDLTRSAREALKGDLSSQEANSAVVRLNNRELFRVYAPSRLQAQERADLVNIRLERVLTELPPGEEPPVVSVRVIGQERVLMVGDQPLLTVTEADALAYDMSAQQIATEWDVRIEGALTEAVRERRPEFLGETAVWAGLVILIGALLHLAVWFIFTKLLARPGWPVQVLIWFGVAYMVTDLFPQSRPLHNLLSEGVLRPLAILLVVGLAAATFSRLLGIVLLRLFPPLPDTLSPEERTERTIRRRATLGAVALVTGVTLIWTVSLFVALTWSGVNLPALLASAGLIGVALGLAAQDTMKDIAAGINILVDDRYGVGDVIDVGSYTGRVEALNLRVTQLRDIRGRLITVPNRTIEAVANLTSRWAQVDFQVGVAYETDLRKAMRVMEGTARQLAEEWPDRILAEPEMLGADSYNASDITLRMLVRTTPGDQWPVARELRVRIKEAFDAAGITIPFPQRTVSFADGSDPRRHEPADERRESGDGSARTVNGETEGKTHPSERNRTVQRHS
jgi:small conductance mechanosensitive channel